ncbi:MAG: ferrous iron transport protein B [Bacteroidetes bacterium GWA2_40_14]|jgi:ferrous iron transport protein B|nr:MAG: ferrous iron transport protein B [Bacteroidetes bacterium GWA2_40_14]HAZ00907.1 ferrous iron transport protein B [Marinilabiliales bacterium]
MNLAELHPGAKAVIVKVKGHGSFRKRIMEMGFIKGQLVEVIKRTPFRGPSEYNVMGYHVSLRPNEAHLIEVITPEMAADLPEQQFEGIIDLDKLKTSVNQEGKNIQVAFVGNPNCGKTSLFNFVSGAREHVGNYSGVTVEAQYNTYDFNGYHFLLTDLPGTYSLTAYTPEELYVRKHIFHNNPDIVVNVIDASNLERNLYLTTQLIDMDIKVVIALNMYDDLKNSGAFLDIDKLSRLLGIPIIPTVATKGEGLNELFNKVIDVYENRDPNVRHVHINYGREVEQSIQAIRQTIKEDTLFPVSMSHRFLAIKLLEQDGHAIRFVTKHQVNKDILKTGYHEISRIEGILSESSEAIITDAKYGFISGALKETLKPGYSRRWFHTNAIDKILTHKFSGMPLFLFFMFLMFYATFQLGSYPMDWIDSGVGLLNEFLKQVLPAGMFNDLITDGIITGVGSVLVFLPNILILFLFISFMEDTGYMARAAFMMDKVMHKIGLHGRSFIPLIMGFGCNVPAIMATRTIRNRTDRLLTILITPFMSCSARLPVYILFVGAFFPNNPTSVLIGLYLTGILLAVVTAHLFNKTLFKSKEAPFVMELPPYRIPSFRSIVKHMWDKSEQYLKKVGGVILIAVVIIWVMGYFPREVEFSKDYHTEMALLKHQMNQTSDSIEMETCQRQLTTLHIQMESEHLSQSYLGKVGRLIEPVIAPLGFEWRMGIALLSGTAAKEVVVGTMGVLLQANEGAEPDEQTLMFRLRELKYEAGEKAGQPVFTPIIALAFLVFVLIYSPCIGVVSAIAKETGRWRWALFMVTYTTFLAWILAFAVKQIGALFF